MRAAPLVHSRAREQRAPWEFAIARGAALEKFSRRRRVGAGCSPGWKTACASCSTPPSSPRPPGLNPKLYTETCKASE